MTTSPLFFVGRLPMGDSVELTGDEGRHAARVRRLTVGEQVMVADGSGAVLHCVVRVVRPDGLLLDVTGRRQVPRPDPWLVVVQALPKGDRGELSVELLTELGVDEIVPWSAARSITRWQGERGAKAWQRWQRTAYEAAKQSRRPRVPVLAELEGTLAVAARLACATTALVLHESAATSLVGAPTVLDEGSTTVVVVVGPEGGLSDEELHAFEAAGARAVRLGEPVLRTSTAGAAAAAVLSVRLGRWT